MTDKDFIEEDIDRIIETVDEDGNKFKFELHEIINYDDKMYAVLEAVDMPEDEEEEEIVIMRVTQDGEDDYTLEYIDSDEEFENVKNYIMELEEEVEE
jgi:hypothetical protein